jgi:hypothetical protein
MRKTLVAFIALIIPLQAATDAFRERFADPETRSQALAELVPGTRDAYFHTALDHQLAGREAEFRKTLADWKTATEHPTHRVSSAGLATLENRQLLIDFQNQPAVSLAELIRRLDLEFEHTRPDAAAAAESLPTRLDPALITEAAFEQAAAAVSPKTPYTEFSDQRILRELDQVESFDEAKIRWFLNQLDRADLPGVVPLIDRSLTLERPVPFGSTTLHRLLTSNQLTSLLELHPSLRSSQDFNIAYLSKLRPGTETDFARDPAAHAEHLRICKNYVLTLPPALNSLKAHVLYHHLRLQAALGQFSQEDFLSYLALPRQRHPILCASEIDRSARVDLDAGFSDATGCPPIGDEIPLIESLLQHFLAQSESPDAFADLIPEKNMLRLHARARLLAGHDPSLWAAALDPAEFKSLQDESRITFAPGAPTLLRSADEVKLALDLKNTPDLLIRIYELDLPAHLTRHGSEPDVNIDLDGLVPHHQRTIHFPQAPIIEHRQSIELPELAGPGAWLVDVVSGQVSARALIRKGHLTTFPDRNATAQTLRVFDESGKPVSQAILTLGRESFHADPSGLITIPNAPNQAATHGVVAANSLATSVKLAPRTDDIALDARFHLDREQLLADHETKLLLRIRLTNHGHELPLDLIQNPALVLKAGLLGGVTTERVIAENLTLQPVMEIPFQVPSDLLSLTLTLRGTLPPPTGGDPIKLSRDITYLLNGGLTQARIGSAFFSPVPGGHQLEVLGRNGEPLASRAIHLTCHRFDYDPPVKVRLRTDENGRTDLGKLDTIDYLEVTGTDIADATYEPNPRLLEYPSDIHLPAGSEIRLPLLKPAAAPDRLALSLIERRDSDSIRDHFDKLSIDNNQLVIRNLPPGDHRLVQDDHLTDILISSGTESAGLLVSDTRILPLHSPAAPDIESATAENGQVTIRLRGHGPGTRVSVVALHHQDDDWNSGSAIYPFEPAIPRSLETGFLGCGFLTDRLLSDEMRYILDRRAAKTFPGSMLPRPGLLLNRWTEKDMFQDTLLGGDGSSGRDQRPESRREASGESQPARGRDRQPSQHNTVCDFLANPAVTRFNLTPQPDGSITLPIADFKDFRFLRITATDSFAADTTTLPLPAGPLPLRDRRIARPLDPQAHYLATRSAATLAKGATAAIENLLDADWRAFTTLAEAHQFLFGMIPDDRIREFVFLTEWPDLPEPRKLELLAQHACHELHLFLARRDRPFFETHVKPILAHKPEPTFIDDLLLDRDLTPYLKPYAWQRLNAAEKALLARALPDARNRIARELSLRWELEAPTPDADTQLFTQTLRGTDLALEDSLGLARNEIHSSGEAASGVAYLTEKLRRIIIPRIDFEDTTVEEAIDFLRLRSSELDTLELDPSRKGINYVIRRPLDSSSSHDPGRAVIKELRLRNVPLAVALKYICDSARLTYKADDFAVTLMPQTETGEDLLTRTFTVPPDFASSLAGGDHSSADPFASNQTGSALEARRPISELLKQAGIQLPTGASATLSPSGTLIVTAQPSELDKVEQLTSALSSSAPSAQSAGFLEADEAGEDIGILAELPNLPALGDEVEEEEENGDSYAMDPFAAAPSAGGGAELRFAPRRPTLFPERTRLWRESNYCRNSGPSDESLIPLNRFWIDLANWDGEGSFLSPHFNACHRSANEALMCLALLDLPFKAERPEVSIDGSSLRVKAREPMLLFYKDTRQAEAPAAESPLLLRQAFTPLAEPVRIIDGREVENPVTGDFRPGIAYASSLVVTNPTGSGRRIDVLAQIPAGAIPLAGHTHTLSSTHEIAPHGVLKLALAFYFPALGEFPVYPLHLSENGVVLSHTEPRTLRVSNDPAPADAASWQTIAAEGTDAQVIDHLRSANLNTLDLNSILWRLQNKEFFLKITTLLRDRLHFSAPVASYGFLHAEPSAIREYLENSRAVTQLGQWLDSPLLDVRPRIHHDWQTLEFDPLINPRAHRFTDESRITHEEARDHYHAFLDQLAWKPDLNAADHLTLTAFLFLQDRIDEALDRFTKIDPAELKSRLHYDYLRTIVLFYQENPGDARIIAEQTLPTLPPGTWRDRFQTVVDQAKEIASLDQPDPTRNAAETIAEPVLDLTQGDAGNLVIHHRATGPTTLRLFNIDLEVLFSKDPFLKDGSASSAEPAIRPNHSIVVPLDPATRQTTVELPESLRGGSLLAAAESANTRLLRVLDSRAITLKLDPLNRILRVTDTATGKPLPKTYVKIYTEDASGQVSYHKDGYTDLRGSFDYLSHTGTDLTTIQRLAILASHPEKGARTLIQPR